ncbi:MAG: hypothetical protein ACPGRX_02240, partial [Bdellovibrionales bacterium]
KASKYMPITQEQTRKDIAAFLPHAIQTALLSYREFSEAQITDPESSPSSATFKAHHDACKVAIAHIELLLKLAALADLPDPAIENEEQMKEIQAVMGDASKTLGRE